MIRCLITLQVVHEWFSLCALDRDRLLGCSFYSRHPNGKRKKFNVYAETRDQCEIKLAEMIAEKKAEIAEEKAKQKEGAD